MKQLYFEYLKEREGASILSNEHSFIVYKLASDHVYLQDIYTAPEARDTKSWLRLYEQFLELVRAEKIKLVFVSIVPSAAGSDKSLSMALKFGYKLHSASNDVIYLRKEI